jgi:hypothetical protein
MRNFHFPALLCAAEDILYHQISPLLTFVNKKQKILISVTLQTHVGPLDHHQGIRCASFSRNDEVYNMSYVKITSNIYYLKNCFYFDFVSTATTTCSCVLVS